MSDAEAAVRNLLDEVAEKQNYNNHEVHLKSFSTGGANYSSELFNVTLSAPGKEDLKLFVKVASVGENFRAAGFLDQLYVSEQQFYNEIMNVWMELQEKYEIPEKDKFIMPKYFAGSPKKGFETVVMENLMEYGYTTHNRFKIPVWEYVAKSIEALAKFHALSFIHRKEYPDEYEKIAEQLKFQMPSSEDMISQTFGKIADKPLQVLKNDEERMKAEVFFKGGDMAEMYVQYNSPRRHPILIHGDYRPSNLMHKEQDGSFVVIPVDYQTIRVGCPLNDLLYFIVLCTDEDFRKQYWDQMMEHYYQQLSLALQRFQMDPEIVYPKEEFDEDLKEMLPYALLVGVIALPIITVEEASAPQMTGDAEIENMLVNPSDLFAERFTGLIRDGIRWGIL